MSANFRSIRRKFINPAMNTNIATLHERSNKPPGRVPGTKQRPTEPLDDANDWIEPVDKLIRGWNFVRRVSHRRDPKEHLYDKG